MKEMLLRFVIGGVVVSIFAVLDLFKPKSFAGLFAAAPIGGACNSRSDCSPQRQIIRGDRRTIVPIPTSTFFGSHPRKWQVPPNGRESMNATDQPALRHLKAAADAADPVPITMRSNFCNYSTPLFVGFNPVL